jgi:hypothetical protein
VRRSPVRPWHHGMVYQSLIFPLLANRPTLHGRTGEVMYHHPPHTPPDLPSQIPVITPMCPWTRHSLQIRLLPDLAYVHKGPCICIMVHLASPSPRSPRQDHTEQTTSGRVGSSLVKWRSVRRAARRIRVLPLTSSEVGETGEARSDSL